MTDDSATYARPPGVDGGFADRPAVPPYSPPPPTVSPQERAVFSRPSGAGSFAPALGERIAARPVQQAPVPRIFADTFGATPDAQDGFAPPPGARIGPAGPPPKSPWWQPNALRDPWRDPSSPFWLGRGAVFTGGRPNQLDPDLDAESADDVLPFETDDEDLEPARDNVRRVRFGLSTLAIALLLALVAGTIGGVSGWFLADHVHDALHRPDVKIAQVETPTKPARGSIADVAKRVGPAVVSITISTPEEFAIGSGVVIDKDGDVLTNNHVVAAAAAAGSNHSSIVVTFSNEANAKAVIVGRDPTSDLAVIKVPNDELTVAQLGDSDKLVVGEPVIAIGSPLGLQGTVTAGIVSALNRPVHAGSEDGTSDAYLDAIQTDAPINPGNSGGALVNSSGAVIGINAAGDFTANDGAGGSIPISGIGYAIPINYARTIALELIHTGKAVHGSFGATGVTALSGLKVGAYIKQISPGGPAAKAGLHVSDVVISADGVVVQSFDQLRVIVQQHKPGDRIPVTYYRGNKKHTTTVTLATE